VLLAMFLLYTHPVASLTIDVYYRSCILVDCKDIKLVMKHRVTSHNQM
jgi:hypothetical protein